MPVERMPPETDTPQRPNLDRILGQVIDQAEAQNAQMQQVIQLAEQRANERAMTPEARRDLVDLARRNFQESLFPNQTDINPLINLMGRGQRPPEDPRVEQDPGEIDPNLIPLTDAEKRQQLLSLRLAQQAKTHILGQGNNRHLYENGSDEEKAHIQAQITQVEGRLRLHNDLSNETDEDVRQRAARSREPGRYNEETEEIQIVTQTGLKEKVHWPKSAEGKIKHFRSVMFDIEDNFAEENTGTHRGSVNELFGVVSALRQESDPAKQELRAIGEKLFEEFTRRYAFQAVYVKYATAADANGVAEGAAGTYDLMQNLILRDLDHGFYDQYDQVDPENPNVKVKKDLTAESKNLRVWKSFNWYHKNAKKIRETANDEQQSWHDKLQQELIDSGMDKDDAASSQILGQRMWEITLRRSMDDEIVNTDTLQGYDTSTPEGRKKLEEDAKNRKVDFKGNVKGGTQFARRTGLLSQWLWTQWGNYRFKSLDLVEGIDFNNRDMFAHIPGDLEGFLKKELLIIYNSTPVDIGNGVISTIDPKATGEYVSKQATKIAEAIIGVKKDKWSKSSKLVDFSQLVFEIEDLDNLERPSDMSEAEFVSWKAERKEILEMYKYDETKTVDQNNSNKENARIRIANHFKGGYFDFKRVRPASAMVSSSFKGQEEIRGFLTKPDGILRNPTAKSALAFAQTFNFLNAGQFERYIQAIRDYIIFEKRGGFFGDTGLSSERAEIIINELALKLQLNEKEVADLKRDLVWEEDIWYRTWENILKSPARWSKEQREKLEKDGHQSLITNSGITLLKSTEAVSEAIGTAFPETLLFVHEAVKLGVNKAAIGAFLGTFIFGILKEGTNVK